MVSLLIRTGSLASKYSISSPPTAPDIAIDALAWPPPHAAALSDPDAGHPHPVPLFRLLFVRDLANPLKRDRRLILINRVN